MPLRVGKLKRSALTHFAKRMTAGEQLKPRFDRLLRENGKLLRELVRELQRVDDNRQQSPSGSLTPSTTREALGARGLGPGG
jgi:hypothetical protein